MAGAGFDRTRRRNPEKVQVISFLRGEIILYRRCYWQALACASGVFAWKIYSIAVVTGRRAQCAKETQLERETGGRTDAGGYRLKRTA